MRAETQRCHSDKHGVDDRQARHDQGQLDDQTRSRCFRIPVSMIAR